MVVVWSRMTGRLLLPSLGIRPDLPQGEIAIIPQLPSTWPNLSINNVRIGDGTLSASTSHAANQYTTTASVPGGLRVEIGYPRLTAQ
jgi:hypothetical protein